MTISAKYINEQEENYNYRISRRVTRRTLKGPYTILYIAKLCVTLTREFSRLYTARAGNFIIKSNSRRDIRGNCNFNAIKVYNKESQHLALIEPVSKLVV